ncbi:FadR/GntR family transcriptional regulator [Streptomyces millisiae]|uniref:FadR/GntR family transcriptional regulator n=1 Tax=Streptomyces millisiae TaxID=3075542 RepID=A0ABU2LM41_9ACTN|nr:FadR/GntR family transcriptional regulator [Streptomyces sp. DSM 44918]MDT0318647.1 FadR/GntR family transcriptional regulator [Streptomyces sp. DSM 44918]
MAGLTRIERGEPATPAVEVARRLLDHLLTSGQVRAGDRLPPERQLAETFGVGRSAVREALKSLSLLGLVDIRQGDGTYVRDASSDLLPQVLEWGLLLGDQTVDDLLEARACVETDLAELAAARRTDNDLVALDTHFSRMAAAHEDPAAYLEADLAFHRALAQAAHNVTLAGLQARLETLVAVWIKQNIRNPREGRLAEHTAVLDAVRAGDPRAAREAMRAHMTSATRRLRARLAANQ